MGMTAVYRFHLKCLANTWKMLRGQYKKGRLPPQEHEAKKKLSMEAFFGKGDQVRGSKRLEKEICEYM